MKNMKKNKLNYCKIKNTTREGGIFMLIKLLSLDSLYGTSACTSAAIDAFVSIDNVFVIALRDSADGALTLTCTACNAVISNYMSHWYTPPCYLTYNIKCIVIMQVFF